MRVEIPMLPPPECSSNYHGSIRARISATKRWRDAAYYCVVDARNRQRFMTKPLPYAKVLLIVEFVIPHNGYERDLDNAITGLKPVVDALGKAGVMLDDKQEYIQYQTPFTYTINKSNAPSTIITVIEVK